jgi:hypothetical protein
VYWRFTAQASTKARAKRAVTMQGSFRHQLPISPSAAVQTEARRP